MYYPYGLAPAQTNYPQKHDIIRVSGKPGAEAFQMAPNSQIILLDETAPMIWLKVTDGAGYPTLTAYDITVHEAEKPVDYKSFDERLKKLEAIIDAKPDTVTVK